MQLTSGIHHPILQTHDHSHGTNKIGFLPHALSYIWFGQIHLQYPWLLPPWHKSTATLWRISPSLTTRKWLNNMRLYLCLSTLTEITDHTGMGILPKYLTPHMPNQQVTLNSLGSTLQWPTQPEPSKQTWKLWKNTLHTLYTHTTTPTLQKPLGPWLPTHKQDWQWKWLWCPHTKTLYHHMDQWWYQCKLHTSTWRQLNYHTTKTATIPSQQHLLPVTPQHNPCTNHIQLALPIPELSTSPAHKPDHNFKATPTYPHDIWVNKLWDNIVPHFHIHTLHNKIAAGHQITIVSDTLMNAANNSCFAWIIATTHNEWTGTGLVPGSAEDNHTGRAKTYGVLTALQFLQHYLNHYPTNYSQAKSIKAFCNNCGIIQ